MVYVVRVKNYEEALKLPNEHEYGRVSIFTRGDTARDFAHGCRSAWSAW